MGISVIIPVHNSEKYLNACIESVISQMGSDDEIILVENGSTDKTSEICNFYVERYENIKYIELGPVGVAAARNKGIKLATCEWVTFLDSDDKLFPKALEVVKKFQDELIDVVITNYSRDENVRDRMGKSAIIPSELLGLGVLQWAKYRKEILKYGFLDHTSIWSCWGKYYRKQILLEHQIIFPEGISYSEDTAFCFQVFCIAKGVLIIPHITYYYRINEQSVCGLAHTAHKLVENNQMLIKYFEEYRKRFNLSNMDTSFDSFYARKIIEIYCDCLIDKQYPMNKIKKRYLYQMICNEMVVHRAIDQVSYLNIINGKKNSIKYAIILWMIKHRLFNVLFAIT